MGCEKRPPDQQMQVTEIRIPARNQPISSLRCDYITQATKQVRNADRENNRYCNGNVVEELHDQLASSIGKGTALSSNEIERSHRWRWRALPDFQLRKRAWLPRSFTLSTKPPQLSQYNG